MGMCQNHSLYARPFGLPTLPTGKRVLAPTVDSLADEIRVVLGLAFPPLPLDKGERTKGVRSLMHTLP